MSPILWRRKIDLLACFLNRHRRWPLHHSPDPMERDLAAFLTLQRRLASGDHPKSARFGVSCRRHLDTVVPGWRAVERERTAEQALWWVAASQLHVFRLNRRRWPQQTAAEPEERELGEWLTVLRDSGTAALDAEQQRWLDAHAPGWDRANRAPWDLRADQLGQFHQQHGRWPSPNAADTEERRLGTWYRSQLSRARGTHHSSHLLTAARRELLDAVAPGWDDGVQPTTRVRELSSSN